MLMTVLRMYTRCTMSDDQFTKLFKYIQEFRREMNTRLDEKASQTSVDSLTNNVDGFAKRLEHIEIEQISSGRQVDRLRDWAHKVAHKTGVSSENL